MSMELYAVTLPFVPRIARQEFEISEDVYCAAAAAAGIKAGVLMTVFINCGTNIRGKRIPISPPRHCVSVTSFLDHGHHHTTAW